MRKQPCVYIMASQRNGTIYVGVTSSVKHRCWQHRSELTDGFTKKYSVKHLVYMEFFETMPEAIKREKQLKSWTRKRKLGLIEKDNPKWNDLFPELL